MSNKATRPALVMYHKDCADGFLAAATIKASGKLPGAEYVPVQYGDITVDNYDEDWAHMAGDRKVWIVDFSVKPDVMDRLMEDAERVFWLDHHKTAFEDYGLSIEKTYRGTLLPERYDGKLVGDLDNGRSGAMIAWDIAYNPANQPRINPPAIIEHVDDRDRWVWALPDTRDVMAGFFAEQPWDLDEWADMLRDWVTQADRNRTVLRTSDMRKEGRVLNKAMDADIEQLMYSATPALINGDQRGLIVNAPHKYASELGHKLAELSGTYAIVWRTEGRRVFCSLRGADGYDVSELAKMFGGGGHAGAAGFECDLTMLETFMGL
jgi:oligoribonuclease NrnB/cAMP/cGMP phosphodiesterase (DHH superfamily)